MVVALLALSLVMILGGIAAVVQGFPYVRLESGLAMVIGGSTAASAGVILLGLTAVLDRLRKLGDSLDRRLDASPGQDVPQSVPAAPAFATPAFAAAPWEAEAPAASASAAAPEVAPERPSLAAMGAGMGAAGLAGLSIGALRPGARGSEPVFEDPTPPAETAAEPLLPDLLPDSAPAPERPPTVEAGAEEDLFAAPEPARHAFPEPEPVALHDATDHGSEPQETYPQETHPQVTYPEEARPEEAPAPETIGLRSSLDEPAPEPAAELPVEAEPAAPHAETTGAAPDPERHAVGSYASGANTYVMFSDGSIEADTPRGRFTFASLDELKSFVNAGGEETRGAA